MSQSLNHSLVAVLGGAASALVIAWPSGSAISVPAGLAARPAANAVAVPLTSAETGRAANSAATSSAPVAAPAQNPPDRGQLRPLPFAGPSVLGATTCDSSSVAHASGLATLGGSGTDTVSGPGTQNDRGSMAQDHVPVEYRCLNATTDGNLLIEIVVLPLGSDSTSFQLEIGPGGVTASSVTPGHDFATIPVGARLGGWPGGCDHVALTGAGPDRATVNDTLCFAADGALTRIEMHETAQRADGTSRRLDATLAPVNGG